MSTFVIIILNMTYMTYMKYDEEIWTLIFYVNILNRINKWLIYKVINI